MIELLRNAWSGWLWYTDNGKFAALLLVVLLFLWLRRGHRNKTLLIYTTVAALLCIFPMSAAFLMQYQTRFYDYEWIWSIVPVTMMIAYGITVFLGNRWENYEKEVRQKGNTVTKKLFWENLAVTAGVVAVVLLCGRLGNPVFVAKEEASERQWAKTALEDAIKRKQVLDEQVQNEGNQGLVLWAPQEVMAYARAYDGNIRLVYGRNMWDKSLMGYSYETYDDVEESLYLWMSSVEAYPNQSCREFLEGGISCVEAAAEKGVNCILLPGDTARENVEALGAAIGRKVEAVEGYYVFWMMEAE